MDNEMVEIEIETGPQVEIAKSEEQEGSDTPFSLESLECTAYQHEEGKEVYCFTQHADLQEAIREFEIRTSSKFNIRQEVKGFSIVDMHEMIRMLEPLENKHIRWEGHWGTVPINYDGVPYVCLGTRKYTCHQGKDKNVGKKRKFHAMQAIKIAGGDLKLAKNYKGMQRCKKVDCPVNFVVFKVLKFPEFKISSDTRSRRDKASKALKENLAALISAFQQATIDEIIVHGHVCYFTVFPSEPHQYHMEEEPGKMTEPLDPELESYLYEVIKSGVQDTKELEVVAAEYVRDNVLYEGNLLRRRFSPTPKKLQEMKRKIKNEEQKLKIDQLSLLKDAWEKSASLLFESRMEEGELNELGDNENEIGYVVKNDLSDDRTLEGNDNKVDMDSQEDVSLSQTCKSDSEFIFTKQKEEMLGNIQALQNVCWNITNNSSLVDEVNEGVKTLIRKVGEHLRREHEVEHGGASKDSPVRKKCTS